MGAITQAQQAISQPGQQQTFKDYMTRLAPQFAQVMPKGFTPERLIGMAISARNRTPKLSECDMSSFLSCCLQCASLGLEPSAVDGLGRAYIIPRWNGKSKSYEATFLIGKQGLLELVRRSGLVKSLRTQCVFEGDSFTMYEDEFGIHFEYKPDLDAVKSPQTFRLVYLSAQLTSGGSAFIYMTKAEVDEVMSTSQSKDRDGNPVGPWKQHYLAMAEKSIIRRACSRGILPMSTDVAKAVAGDDSTPVVLDSEGYEVLHNVNESISIDPETGEIKETDNDNA